MSKNPLEIHQNEQIEKEGTLAIFPTQALLSSHKSGWKDIHLAHFYQPAWESPEFSNALHTIGLAIPHQIVTNEFIVEGCLQRQQYHPNNPTIAIFPANRLYKIYLDKSLEFIHFYLEPSFVSHVAHEEINPDRVEILFKPNKADLLIYQICLALKADLNVDGSGTGFYADSMATTLAAHLLRHYSTHKYQLRQYEDGFSKHKLQQTFDYINAKLYENVSLTEIATELDMSQYYFCRLFKKSTGITPHQYLIQQRVERAKELLRQPENKIKIADVAMDCGFANPSHFAKHFRKYTGVSPKQFRNL
jgi:AraC family transcriptional regulator